MHHLNDTSFATWCEVLVYRTRFFKKTNNFLDGSFGGRNATEIVKHARLLIHRDSLAILKNAEFPENRWILNEAFTLRKLE